MPKTGLGMVDINKNKVSFNFLKSLDIAAINRELDLLHPCAHEFWEEEEIRNSLHELYRLKRVRLHKMKQQKP